MSSSFTPSSASASQRPEAVPVMPNPALQTANNSNAAAVQTSAGSTLQDDPTERWTGQWAKVMNDKWTPAPRRSVLQANLELDYPDILEYYEARRTGKIEAKSFDDWGEDVSLKEKHRLYDIEHDKIKRVFHEVDYNRGFTGRGVLPESMERPGLVGPRNETVEEIAGPASGVGYEQRDRRLWQDVDYKSGCPSGKPKDIEDVGPLGEPREDEDVGPLGESRDGEDVGPHGETRDDNDEEQPKASTVDEILNNTLQLATEAVGKLSRLRAKNGAARTSTTSSTASSGEPGASLTSSSHTLSSTPPSTLGKRTRDSEEEAKDDESPLRQKRRRMDDALGIVRKSANAVSNAQSTGVAMAPDVQQSRKRAKTSNDDSEESTSRPSPKRARLRLYMKPRGDANNEQAHVADGTPPQHESTVGHQPISSNEGQNHVTVNEVSNVEVHRQASMEEVPFANGETSQRVDAAADDEATLSQRNWDTVHGINSSGADIRVRGMGVYGLTGEWERFYLPSSGTSSPCRPLTDTEKEDLRVYIQDYGVKDWKTLAKSMNRTVREVQTEYVEYIMARNKKAGRHETAGLPPAFPDLAPPPPPPPLPDENKQTPAQLSVKLRPRAKTCKFQNNSLGDLKYDLKAQSFPRITKDGGMIDAKGNALLGIMGKIPAQSYGKRRQSKKNC